MLGPFKILAPFVKITKNADPALARKIAVRAILISIGALVLAAFLGENNLSKYSVVLGVVQVALGAKIIYNSLITLLAS